MSERLDAYGDPAWVGKVMIHNADGSYRPGVALGIQEDGTCLRWETYPHEARALAADLLTAADEAEGIAGMNWPVTITSIRAAFDREAQRAHLAAEVAAQADDWQPGRIAQQAEGAGVDHQDGGA